MDSLDVWEGGQELKKEPFWLMSSQLVPYASSLPPWPGVCVGSFREISCAYAEMSFHSPQNPAWVPNTHFTEKETGAGRLVSPRSPGWAEAGLSRSPALLALGLLTKVGWGGDQGSGVLLYFCVLNQRSRIAVYEK